MESVKKIFTLKKVEKEEDKPSFTNEKTDQVRVTYYQSGYNASTKASGNPITLLTGLHNLYHSFEDQCRKQMVEQQRLKQPYKEEQERQRTELKKRETALAIFEEQQRTLINDIEKRKQDIVDVKQNPFNHGIEEITKRPKAQFYIGLLILIPITIYLLVFYISASYSAFFKTFQNTSLSAAIFDPNSLTDAIKASWLEGLLVITIPFVFLGLGYVIHMLQKEKAFQKYFKISALFIITFLFDGLLAFIIEKKIYDFNKTPLSPPFNLKIALTEAEFWMIIFAGFVVYIIWGLVFDLIMKEYENLDKIKAFIRNKKAEIKNLLDKKDELLSNIDSIKQEITSIIGKISELQSKIDGFIFPVKEYLHYHFQYKEGWYQAISEGLALSHEKQQELLNNCEKVAANHLKEYQLTNMDHQQLVYSKNQE